MATRKRAQAKAAPAGEGSFDTFADWERLSLTQRTRLPANALWRVPMEVIDPHVDGGLRLLTTAST